jgi:hypothetical protein
MANGSITTAADGLSASLDFGGTPVVVWDGSKVGICGSPQAWQSTYKAVDISSVSGLYFLSGQIGLYNNFYVDSGGAAKYTSTAYATQLYQANSTGVVQILTYPSGTAGSALGSAATTFKITQTDVVMSSANGGLGYGAGAGGTVTQATSKSTAVTLNKPCGQITMNNAALGAGATVAFTFNNSLISATDLLIVQVSGDTPSSNQNYTIRVYPYNTGAAIYVKNETAGSLSDAVLLKFAIIKGANA